MVLRIVLSSMFIFVSSPALAVYKCESGGKVTYSDAPCANARQLDVKDAVLPADAAQASQRAKREKAELNRIDATQKKVDAQADRNRQQFARTTARQTKTCDLLALRKKTRDDAITTATPKAVARARIKARQAGERFDLECSKTTKSTTSRLN